MFMNELIYILKFLVLFLNTHEYPSSIDPKSWIMMINY